MRWRALSVPTLPKTALASVSYGIWKNDEDGPASWRRSVYVYRRRGLVFPMFQVFDLPKQNVTAGAWNVSTVPTQALMLLNDPFVLGLDHAKLTYRFNGRNVRLTDVHGVPIPQIVA